MMMIGRHASFATATLADRAVLHHVADACPRTAGDMGELP
jgi:hypothetical protein